MPTNRKRRTRTPGHALADADKAALTVGCGWNGLNSAQRDRLRKLWNVHGDRLIEQAPKAWGMLMFGEPERTRGD